MSRLQRPGSLVAVALCALAGTVREAAAVKPEPPLAVSVRLLSADASRGRYRVEVRLRADTELRDAALVVRVVPRPPGASAAAAARPAGPRSREPLLLVPRRELRRQLDILTGPQEPVTLLVGLDGRAGNARLHRTSALELGPPAADDAPARVRTDQLGRTYYEVPLQEPR